MWGLGWCQTGIQGLLTATRTPGPGCHPLGYPHPQPLRESWNCTGSSSLWAKVCGSYTVYRLHLSKRWRAVDEHKPQCSQSWRLGALYGVLCDSVSPCARKGLLMKQDDACLVSSVKETLL